MLEETRRELSETFLRTRFYRYDFPDGTNSALLAARWLAGGHFARDWVGPYEAELARFTGLPHAVSFGAGRMALYAILEALGVGPGDEVLLPAFTCVAVPNAVLYRGARPAYADIREEDFNVDPGRLEAAVTPRTRAILAQHTFGRPCDIDAVLRVARRRGLAVIEDCAHAFGATLRGRPLGTFGDAAFASTDHTKMFSTSTGGFAVCASDDLGRRLKAIQARSPGPTPSERLRIPLQYALLALLSRPRLYWLARHPIGLLGLARLWHYPYDELELSRPERYPARLSNFQAYVGFHEMRRLGANVEHRRRTARRYQEILLGRSEPPGEGSWLRYSLLVRDPERWERALGRYFAVGRWFSTPAHGREKDLEAVGYRPGSCPTAESVCARIVNFPTERRVDERALGRFAELVEDAGLKAEILLPPGAAGPAAPGTGPGDAESARRRS